ncbi:hypothetical protein C8N40_110118 [Pontibacter mucosus]|uniref:Uncharacterized protein n=1 Tax=Pontibacter mucosus TaxID=1649266 RepID=A0A2T5YDR5_9BACT|nr:hypothetical protein [Pontibacter mucosus]PTX14689.1 hypothetical protein C8N40_110118 [Pontibacter mucosus]
MKIYEDAIPIPLEEFDNFWPLPFMVHCIRGIYNVQVETPLPEAATYHLVIPDEDYHYALKQYIKLKDDAQDFCIDVLLIRYNAETQLHSTQSLRLSVTYMDEFNPLNIPETSPKLILQFAEFINLR